MFANGKWICHGYDNLIGGEKGTLRVSLIDYKLIYILLSVSAKVL